MNTTCGNQKSEEGPTQSVLLTAETASKRGPPRLTLGWYTEAEVLEHDNYIATRAYEHREPFVREPFTYHYTQREMFDRMLQEARETNDFHLKRQLQEGQYFEDCPRHHRFAHELFEKDRKKRNGEAEIEPAVKLFNFLKDNASDNNRAPLEKPKMLYVSYDSDGQRVLSTAQPERKIDPRIRALFKERKERLRMHAEDVYEINCDDIVFKPQPKPRDYVWDLFFNPTPALYAAVDVVNDVLNAVKKHIEGSEEVGMINKKKLK